MNEIYEMELDHRTGLFLALLVLGAFVVACLWTLGAHLDITIFEDGSFILGQLSGCLPGGICNN